MKDAYLFNESFEIYSERLLVSFREESGLITSLIQSALETPSTQHSGWGLATLEDGAIILRESSLLEDSVFSGFPVFADIELPDGFSIPLFMHSIDVEMSDNERKSIKKKDNAFIHDFMYSAKDKGINHAVFLTTDGIRTVISLHACYSSFLASRTGIWPFHRA